MKLVRASSSFGLGNGNSRTESVFSKNHFSSETKLSPEVKAKLASMGAVRVAGNAYTCPSSVDFWQVKGNKVVRLTVEEVDNGESLQAAPADNPSSFLEGILGDLTF